MAKGFENLRISKSEREIVVDRKDAPQELRDLVEDTKKLWEDVDTVHDGLEIGEQAIRQKRYASRDEALAGHERAVGMAKDESN